MKTRRSGISLIQGMGLLHLSTDQLDSLHYAAAHLLSDVGISVDYQEAADLFHSAGAGVDKRNGHWLVRIPEWLLTDALASAPKSVTYHARNPKHDLSLEKNKVTFATFGEQIKVNDLQTRQNRNSIKDDCLKAYRLVDALDGLGICQRALCPGDQPPAAQAAHNFQAAMNSTSKHLTIGMVDKHNVEAIRQMAVAISGSEEATGSDRWPPAPVAASARWAWGTRGPRPSSPPPGPVST